MSAKQDTTADRLTILRNVNNWRRSHPVHLTDAEFEQRHTRQQRYWIRNGRIVSIAEAFNTGR